MYVSCDHNFKQWHWSIWLCVSDCITWLEFYQWLFFNIWSNGSVSVYIWVLVNLWHSFMSISLEIRSDQIRSDQIRSDQIRSDQIRSGTSDRTNYWSRSTPNIFRLQPIPLFISPLSFTFLLSFSTFCQHL